MIKLGTAIITLVFLTACGGGGGGGGETKSNTSTATSTSKGSSTSSSTVSVSCTTNAGGAVSFSNNTSHKAGQNCMTCHIAGGSATPMTVAGTVYKSNDKVQPTATIRLYTHNSSVLVATLSADKCGNFYTTRAIPGLFVAGGPLVDGVDPVVEDPSGGLHTMPGLVTSGACNGCHGSTNGKIIAN